MTRDKLIEALKSLPADAILIVADGFGHPRDIEVRPIMYDHYANPYRMGITWWIGPLMDESIKD